MKTRLAAKLKKSHVSEVILDGKTVDSLKQQFIR